MSFPAAHTWCEGGLQNESRQEKSGASGGTYQFCVQDSNDSHTENERGGDQNKQSSFHNNNMADYWQMTAHFARAPPMTWLRNDNEPEARRIAMEMLQTRCRLFPGNKADINSTTRFRNPPTLTCPVALEWLILLLGNDCLFCFNLRFLQLKKFTHRLGASFVSSVLFMFRTTRFKDLLSVFGLLSSCACKPLRQEELDKKPWLVWKTSKKVKFVFFPMPLWISRRLPCLTTAKILDNPRIYKAYFLSDTF